MVTVAASLKHREQFHGNVRQQAVELSSSKALYLSSSVGALVAGGPVNLGLRRRADAGRLAPRTCEGAAVILSIVLSGVSRYRPVVDVLFVLLILLALVQAYRTADSSQQPLPITTSTTVSDEQTLRPEPETLDQSAPAEPSLDTVGPTGQFQTTTIPSTTVGTSTADIPKPSEPTTVPSSITTPTSTTRPTTVPSSITTLTSVTRPSTEPPISTQTTSATSIATTTTTVPPTTSSAVIAEADEVEVGDDKDENIKVLDNDSSSSASLDESTLQIIDPPRHASTYRVHNDHIHYRSLKDFSGTDTLIYRICDTSNQCDTATLTIVVTT